MTSHLRRIVLARYVTGLPQPTDFRVEETAIPDVGEGQFLAKTLAFSVDPGTRSRLSGSASYAAGLKIGQVVDGFSVARVIESRHPKYAAGDLITAGAGWADHFVSDGRGYFARIPERAVPISAWIGVLGVPGMTAYFGLKRVAEMKPGARVLVTSAAGPVGATAGQLAKAWGAAQVVGIAGGAEKCNWLTAKAGFDAAIDRHAANDLDAALRTAMPEGVDVLFDNVGNAMIDRVMVLMRPGGRIVVSGQVADYNLAPQDRPGIRNTAPFITHRLRMEGLVVFDDLKSFPAAQGEVADLIEAGRLAYVEERFEGLEAAPEAFCGLFRGENFGRRIIHLAE